MITSHSTYPPAAGPLFQKAFYLDGAAPSDPQLRHLAPRIIPSLELYTAVFNKEQWHIQYIIQCVCACSHIILRDCLDIYYMV